MHVGATACCNVLWPCGHEHSAAAGAALSSTLATLDSSSTRTPVVAVVVLLRAARAALERTSMSRLPSMAFCTAKDGHGTTVTRLLKQAQQELETNSGTAWSTSHGHTSTQQQQQQHPAALEQQQSPRVALARLLLRLFYCCILLARELDY